MVLAEIADGVSRRVEGFAGAVSEAFFEPVIRLGVTGLSRSGKTIFITSLVANLIDRDRMVQLQAAASGRITAAYLQPQPDDTVPRFDYEGNLAALNSTKPRWPDSTRHVSELRLSLKVRPTGLLGGLSGPRTVHIDIFDYPGEWLLDLSLMDRSFAEWSDETLSRIETRSAADSYRALLAASDPDAAFDEPKAIQLASAFAAYLAAARAQGFSDVTPGRFLLPGDLAGSPVLTFAPLPAASARRGSLYREFQRRYDAYKRDVVRPFFLNHFSRLDRQIVLVDVLGAIHDGPAAVEDTRRAMADILSAFRPGRNGFLSEILFGRRVERILFAATKADHLHHSQHPRLTAIMEALVRDARSRADFVGARTAAMSIASVRATVEATIERDGRELDVVQGILADTGKRAAFHPGDLPEDPAQLLATAREGAPGWLQGDYASMRFSPATLSQRTGQGLPHIRLDRAAEFLLGDRL